jgi:NAD(P)-dependent dehydrogenase (short-subunit alcohol dehydrogenase family)
MKTMMNTKTILLTGATDGIGLDTAKRLVTLGHTLLIHGRNQTKLEQVEQILRAINPDAQIERYIADLSRFDQVEDLATQLLKNHGVIDVVINNAGVFKTPKPKTEDGLDVRFVVNTIAPYLLTRRLLPNIAPDGRVINLSSAAQAPVDLGALVSEPKLGDSEAYAQSKLAITIWSHDLNMELEPNGPMVVAVNPGSLLATNMVKQAYGMDGADIGIGGDILVRAAVSDEFAEAGGRYFDNDSGRFRAPHPSVFDDENRTQLRAHMDRLLSKLGHTF